MAGKRRSAFLNLDTVELPEGVPVEVVKAEFARRLQRAMVEKGWNQSELARQAELHLAQGRIARDNVSQYIRGVVLPGPKNLQALAKALGVNPADLLPARGVPSARDNAPPLEMKDIGDGNVWLRVNQAVDQHTALRIMSLLVGTEK